MNRDRESELLELLSPYKGQGVLNHVTELLTLRRERHRDRLEKAEEAEFRGRAKECKDLIQLFS